MILLQQPAKKAEYCMATNDTTEARTLVIVCGFVSSKHLLIFAVIGCNTNINIPEIFQVFMVLLVCL